MVQGGQFSLPIPVLEPVDPYVGSAGLPGGEEGSNAPSKEQPPGWINAGSLERAAPGVMGKPWITGRGGDHAHDELRLARAP